MAQDTYGDVNGFGGSAPQNGGTDPNRRNTIAGYYKDILGRDADAGGLDSWTNSGLDLGDIKNAFYGSDEYKARGGAGQNQQTSGWQGGANYYATQPTQGAQPQSASVAPAGARISSWAGYTPQGVEDMWGQFLASKGYTGQADKYGFGGMGSAPQGLDLNALANEFNAQTGLNARAVSGDKIDFGGQGGGVRDVIRSNGQFWIAPGSGQSGVPAGGSTVYGGADVPQVYDQSGDTVGNYDQSGDFVGRTVGGLYTGPAHDPRLDALYNTLLGRSQQSLDVNGNSPAIKAQTDAFNAQADRNRLQAMQAAAERGGAYATGLTGNIARSTAENVGAQKGAFAAALMGKEIDARRTEIQNALTQMGGLLTADQQAALHMADSQLAGRKAAIDAQQTGNQQAWQQAFADKQFGANLAQQNWLNDWERYKFGAGA